jgi:heme-degrading monooxygenase HmoA
VIAKWIACRLPPEGHQAFSESQQGWSRIAEEPGFLNQCGGLSLDAAFVIALWQDRAAYGRFMSAAHDRFASAKEQARLYTSIAVSIFECQSDIRGAQPNFRKALPLARFLRVSDCVVRPPRVLCFIDAQRTIWSPGMAVAPGMLGGTVWMCSSHPNRFLVTTLWVDARSHYEYVRQRLPGLRRLANNEQDLLSLTGVTIPLVESWTVLAGEGD